jgi:hypothetical protein
MATYTVSATRQSLTQIESTSGFNFLVGVWLVVSPLVLALSDAATWNNVVCGAIVAALAIVRVLRPALETRWASLINAVIGVWLVVSPWALNDTAPDTLWNNVAVGATVTLLALLSMMRASRGRRADAVRAASRSEPATRDLR